MSSEPKPGEELTHTLQLQEVEVAQTPEDILANAKRLGLVSVDESPTKKPTAKVEPTKATQKPSENGDKKDDGSDNSPVEPQPCKEGITMNHNTAPQAAPAAPAETPAAPAGLSDMDRAALHEFASAMGASIAAAQQPVHQPPPTAYQGPTAADIAAAIAAAMPQPAAPQPAPQPVYAQPVPYYHPAQAKKEEGFLNKFDTVGVGEKLVTATGYGVIAIGTFAGCCGVAKLMGVVK